MEWEAPSLPPHSVATVRGFDAELDPTAFEPGSSTGPGTGLFGAMLNGLVPAVGDEGEPGLRLPPLDGSGPIDLLARTLLRGPPEPADGHCAQLDAPVPPASQPSSSAELWAAAAAAPAPPPIGWEDLGGAPAPALPHATEAGPEVEGMIISWIAARATVPGGVAPEMGGRSVPREAFVAHAIKAAIGLPSASFAVKGVDVVPLRGLRLGPCSTSSSAAAAAQFAEAGSLMLRLEQYAAAAATQGRVSAALGTAVIDYIAQLRSGWIDVAATADTVLALGMRLSGAVRQLRYVAALLAVDEDDGCRGIALVRRLHAAAAAEAGLEHEHVACALFAAAAAPLLRFLEDWLWHSVLNDPVRRTPP